MITIADITKTLETLAHPSLQEAYDNAGLITGNRSRNCTGILVTLDATEKVVEEAIDRNCNLIIAHHPILFRSIKKLSGDTYPERAIIKAIKNDIAIYAIHTNLDNVAHGVNKWMAEKIGLQPKSLQILAPKTQLLYKLVTYVPDAQAEQVRNALFDSGGGAIGNYVECSFNSNGLGTFRPLEEATPAIGKAGGPREIVAETRMEMVFPAYLQTSVVDALNKSHPYETVAYDIIQLQNEWHGTGSGLIGELAGSHTEIALLDRLKTQFGLKAIRHSAFLNKPVRTVAICGGSGSFLTSAASRAGADAFITSDIKYHEFFDADDKLLLADIGHFESEQFTIQGIWAYLQSKFPTFAVLQTEVSTNPVNYFF